MRKTDVDEPNGTLGAPIRPPLPEPMTPKWRPVADHPAHETDGKDVRLKQSASPNVWDFFGMQQPASVPTSPSPKE